MLEDAAPCPSHCLKRRRLPTHRRWAARTSRGFLPVGERPRAGPTPSSFHCFAYGDFAHKVGCK
eukprot:8971-Eustigmatos_ZCMA.PRE.1